MFRVEGLGFRVDIHVGVALFFFFGGGGGLGGGWGGYTRNRRPYDHDPNL